MMSTPPIPLPPPYPAPRRSAAVQEGALGSPAGLSAQRWPRPRPRARRTAIRTRPRARPATGSPFAPDVGPPLSLFTVLRHRETSAAAGDKRFLPGESRRTEGVRGRRAHRLRAPPGGRSDRAQPPLCPPAPASSDPGSKSDPGSDDRPLSRREQRANPRRVTPVPYDPQRPCSPRALPGPCLDPRHPRPRPRLPLWAPTPCL